LPVQPFDITKDVTCIGEDDEGGDEAGEVGGGEDGEDVGGRDEEGGGCGHEEGGMLLWVFLVRSK
jgi:hypothetical protein